MNVRLFRAGLLAAALASFLLLSFTALEAKTPKPPKELPNNATEKKTLMLAPVEKRFIVNQSTKKAAFDKLKEVENAVIIVDDNGHFPGNGLLQSVAGLNKKVRLVLPVSLRDTLLKSLTILPAYDVQFKLGKGVSIPDLLNKASSLGPRLKIFEMSAVDLSQETLDQLKAAGLFELRLLMGEGEVLTDAQVKMLAKTPGMKEIVLPASYPAKEVGKLKALHPLRLLIQVGGAGPDAGLAGAINQLGKTAAGGAALRGLIKPEEAQQYLTIANLAILEMSVEDWEVTDGFVKLMNSRGEL